MLLKLRLMAEVSMDKIVSLAKRRGFIYPGSEIYGGLAGTWDYGPLGVELKKNIKDLWWKRFVSDREDMYGVDAAILMNEKVWEASGHTGAGFADPLVECKKCKRRFRADHLEDKKNCPECGGELGEEKVFNLLFPVSMGAQGAVRSYLRGETAQGIFVNYKNVLDSFSPKLPFGIAQIGKAFRNEISPRDFVFRSREFEQMEIEYFVKEEDWQSAFDSWRDEMWNFMIDLGLNKEKIHEKEVPEEKLAHYSKKTTDFEYDFPFGTDELYGLAYRTDFDLTNHSKNSGEELVYRTPEGDKFTPHVIEPTFGVDRTILALLSEAYREDDERVWLSFNPKVAPYKVAVFPLLRNKPELVNKAREVFKSIKSYIPNVLWDDNGNVGKRYRRQDEIGTPFCVTVDFESLEDFMVTVRERDSMNQERVKIDELENYFKNKLN
jgi:glycyl-tRNA synthetase